MQNEINGYPPLECYEILSGDDLVLRVVYHSEGTKNSVECPETDGENLITH